MESPIKDSCYYEFQSNGSSFRLYLIPPDRLSLTDSNNEDLSKDRALRKKLQRNLSDVDLYLLKFLIENPNRTYSIKEIDRNVWGKLPSRVRRSPAAKKESDPESKVTTRISYLRKILGDDKRQELIRTGKTDDEYELRSYGFFAQVTKKVCQQDEATDDLAEASDITCPYRGLSVFDEEHAEYFKGRDAATNELIGAVGKRHFVAYTSASGVGKSSVIFAGLIPQLRRQNGWVIISMRPQIEPFQSLANALAPLLETNSSPGRLERKVADLLKDLKVSKNQLCHKADEILQRTENRKHLLLVIDQFEELYTTCEQDNVRKRFLDSLLEFADYCRRSKGQARLLISLRVDFLERSPKGHQFTAAIHNADIRLKPMTREEMYEAIAAPAESAGLQLEPGLAERILDDLGERVGGLPLLEFTLERLWHRRSGVCLTHTAYNDLGKVNKALADYAEKVYSQFNDEQQILARKIFLELIAVSSGNDQAAPSRRITTRSKMDEQEWLLILQLANDRLLMISRDPFTGKETVELTHEALITAWQRYTDWVQQHREFLVWRSHLDDALKKHRTHKDDSNYLLHGPDLNEACRWLIATRAPSSPYSLSDEEEAFIASSRRQQRRVHRRTWRNRLVLAASVVILIAGGVLGLKFYSERSREALTHDLMAQALAMRKDRPDLLQTSILLAIESYKRRPTPEAYQTIYEGLSILPKIKLTAKHDEFVYSPDGRYLITAGEDRTIRYWDVNTSQETKKIVFEARIWKIVISPDGKYLALKLDKDEVIIAGSESGEKMAVLKPPGPIGDIVFSPNGQFLATNDSSGELRSVRIWSVPSGVEMSVFQQNGIPEKAVFSPDSRYVGSVASNFQNKEANIWEIKTGREIHLPQQEKVDDVEFSPDGKFIATSVKGQTIQIWDATSFKKLIEWEQKDGINRMAFSPNGKFIVTGNEPHDHDMENGSSIARNFEVPSGREVATFNVEDHSHSAVFSPDSKYVVSSSFTQIVRDRKSMARVWEANTGREVSRVTNNVSGDTTFSPDGKYLATGSSAFIRSASETGTNAQRDENMRGHFDKKICLWDPFTRPLESQTFETGTPDWRHYATSHNGKYLAASVDGENVIHVWDLSAMKELARIPYEGDNLTLAISDDGKYVAANNGRFLEKQTVVNVWNREIGEMVLALPRDGWVVRMELSSNGEVLAELDNSVVRLTNVKEGKETAILRHPKTSVMSLAFSPNSAYIATGGMGDLRIWDVATGREKFSIGNIGEVSSLAYSFNGRRIAAVVGMNGIIKVYDVSDLRELTHLLNDEENLSTIGFSPDDKYLVTISVNGLTHFWEIDTGQEVARIKQANKEIFFGDNVSLIISENGVFRRQKWLPQDVISEACTRLTSNFTVEEWQKYLPGEHYRRTCDNLP